MPPAKTPPMKFPWSKGPTSKYLDGVKEYAITYRYRKPGEFTWTTATIHSVRRSEQEARKRCLSFLSQRGYEADILRCKVSSEEAPIQSGETVEVVSDGEYASRMAKLDGDMKEGVQDRLRSKGWWLPSGLCGTQPRH